MKLGKQSKDETYTTAVEALFSNLSLPDISTLTHDTQSIDSNMDRVITILTSSAEENIPTRLFSPHLRPAWTAAGHSRHSSHPAWRKYKYLKATFRALLRKHQREQRDVFYQELDFDCEDSGKLFRPIKRA